MGVTKKINDLQTARLLLRPIVLSDSGAFFDIFSDARTMQYWSGTPIQTREEAEALVRQELDWSATESCINWGIAEKDSNLLIGKITLFQFHKQNRRAEIGYILDRHHWGKGLMAEAMARVLDYAFEALHLHRIEADSDPKNLPSLALLEKFGFMREGLFRDRWNLDGEWYDSVMLGLLEQDYRKWRMLNPKPDSDTK